MKKLILEINDDEYPREIKYGYVWYKPSYVKFASYWCKWYLYPIMRLTVIIKRLWYQKFCFALYKMNMLQKEPNEEITWSCFLRKQRKQIAVFFRKVV